MRRVVFVHGMFMTRRCWDGWVTRFAAQGFACISPEWPLRDEAAAELRARHPDPALGKLTFSDVLAHHEAIVRAESEPPYLVGHSLGGLIVQMLLQRGLGHKAVVITSGPPRGILPLQWSIVRSNWPLLRPSLRSGRPVLLTRDQFRYCFAHTLSVDEAAHVWDQHVVPDSRRIFRGAMAATVDWSAPHAPLLFVAASHDHTCTEKMNRMNAARYRPPAELKLFAGRTHYTILDGEGWTEVADATADWLRA